MEITIASDFRMNEQKNIDLNFSTQSVIHATIQEWQSEIIFFKSQSGLLIKLIDRSKLSNKYFFRQKEDSEKERLRFINRDFTLFQKKIEKHLKSFDFEFKKFRKLCQEWQDLKYNYQQVEKQILERVIQNYPVIIF